MPFYQLHFSFEAAIYCCQNELLITRYPVIFNFWVGTGRVLEKKVGTGRVPGSRRTLDVGYMNYEYYGYMNYGYYGYMNYGYYRYMNYGYYWCMNYGYYWCMNYGYYGYMNYDESLDMNHILYKSRRSEINFIAITYDLQSILAKYSWIVKLYWRNISQTTTKGSGFYLHISARLYTPELKKNIAKGTTDLRVEFIS